MMNACSSVRLSLPAWCASAALAVAVSAFAACSGGGGGGDSPPVLLPNSAPLVPLPTGITGTAPRVQWSVPATDSAQVTFVAADPDGDALQWEVAFSGANAAALGVQQPSLLPSASLVLDLAPVASPAVGIVNLLVRDARNASRSLELTVLRSASPDLVAVTPTTAFSGQPLEVQVRGRALALGGVSSTQVSFGGVLATNLVAESADALRCRTPSVALSGPVAVGVNTAFGSDLLPVGSFTMMSFPPVFAALDRRLDVSSGSVSDLEVQLVEQRAHAVYLQLGAVWHARSTDAGQTFAAPTVLSATEVATSPHVVVEGDVVHVVWIGDGQRIWLSRSTDGGATFGPASSLEAVVQPVSSLQLCAEESHVYVGWIGGDPQLAAARAVVAASTNGGATFGSPRIVRQSGGNQRDVTIACDGATVVVGYLDDRISAAVRGFYVARSVDAGANFAADLRLSAPDRAAFEARLASEGSNLHAVWRTSEGISYNGSPALGTNWRTPEVLVRGLEDGVPQEPQLYADGGRVYVAYHVLGNGVYLARSTDGGDTFPARTRLDVSGQATARPRLSGSHEYLAVSWQEGDAGLDAVRATFTISTDRGSTWLLPRGAGDGAHNQGDVTLRLSGGRLLLSLLERRGLSISAYVNTNLP